MNKKTGAAARIASMLFGQEPTPSRADRMLIQLLRGSAGILILGALFSIQRWPFALLIIILGYSSILIICIARFLVKEKRYLIDWLQILLVIIWPVGSIFRIQHWPCSHVMGYTSSLAFWGIVGISILRNSLSWNKSGFSFSDFLPVASFVLITLGAILKVIHGFGANVILFSGIICLIIWFSWDWIKNI